DLHPKTCAPGTARSRGRALMIQLRRYTLQAPGIGVLLRFVNRRTRVSIGSTLSLRPIPSKGSLVLHPRLFGDRLPRGLLLGAEVLRALHSDLDVLVAATAVPLDPLPRDAESLAVLRAGRHVEHHALPVERPDLDLRAEHRLREVDRHHARDVQPAPSLLAPEEVVWLDLDHDDDVAATPRALPLQPEPRAVVGAGRDVDDQAFLDLHVTRALARRTALRRDLPAAAAHGTGPRDRKTSLTEGDGAAPVALGTGRKRRARRSAASAAGGAHLRHPQRHRHLAPQRRDAERDRDGGLALLFFQGRGAASRAPAPPAEDRRAQTAQPADRAEIGEIEADTRAFGRAATTAKRSAARRAGVR